MKLICRLFGHRRSIAEARRYGDVEWRSVCRHCREPLLRIGPGHWVPLRAHRAACPTAEAEG